MDKHKEEYPLVSVVAVCYNHERFVVEALDSIAAQTYPNVELIIVDAKSEDRTVQVVDRWLRKSSISALFIKREKLTWLPANLNLALKNAYGNFVQFISCDDILHPAKIEQSVNVLKNLPEEYSGVYSDAFQITEEGSLLSQTIFEKLGVKEAPHRGNLYPIFCYTPYIQAVTNFFRMSALQAVNYFDESLYYEDWDLLLNLSENGFKFECINEPLAFYRINPSSMNYIRNQYFWDSYYRICLKHLQHAKSNEAKKALTGNLKKAIKNIYLHKKSIELSKLLQLLRISPTFTNLKLVVKILMRMRKL